VPKRNGLSYRTNVERLVILIVVAVRHQDIESSFYKFVHERKIAHLHHQTITFFEFRTCLLCNERERILMLPVDKSQCAWSMRLDSSFCDRLQDWYCSVHPT
jgi:hypothetical protein